MADSTGDRPGGAVPELLPLAGGAIILSQHYVFGGPESGILPNNSFNVEMAPDGLSDNASPLVPELAKPAGQKGNA